MAVQSHSESLKVEQSQSMSSSREESSGAWWSTWLASAKEKSMTALTATKRDLAEFVTVLSSDTKSAVSGASANIKGILGQANSSEQTDGGREGSPAAVQKKNATEAPSAPYDRCQAQIFAVQNSKETYLVDPEDKAFDEWKSKFDVQACQSDISTILVCCSHVRTLHSQLVPAQVSYEAFWTRYFYKIQQLQREEKRRAELMERATKRTEEQIQWDEELEEISASELISPHHKSEEGHQRSESSSDSFVCVSEAASNDTHLDRAASQDPDTWVYLHSQAGGDNGHGSTQQSPQDETVAKLVTDVQNLALFDELGEAGDTDAPEGDGGGGQGEQEEQTGGGDGGGDSGSDWENWDD